MNGIEKITARIQQDASAEMESIRQEAEAQAAKRREEYEAQARTEAEKAAESCKQAAQQRLERLEGAAEMEAKTKLLAAKQACIDEAFAKAKEQLLTMPEADYVELLAKLAVRSAVTGQEELVFNDRDRAAVGSKVVARANQLLAQAVAPNLPAELKESKAGSILTKVVTGANALLQGTAMLTLAADTADIEGGLILRDGQVEVNCAFETQLRLLRESLAGQVAQILFG